MTQPKIGTQAWLDMVFCPAPTTEAQRQACWAIVNKSKELAKVILDNTPPSSDQDSAIRSLRSAVSFCNLAITLNGLI